MNAYFTFNGNCREAMTFYKECLGGELELQTIADSPMGDDFPVELKECILNARLRSEGIIIMGTDMAPENLIKGNAVSMVLTFSSEKKLREVYHKLSEDGEASYPPEVNFYGTLFGNLTDKFGHQWLFHF
ncbi:VOC family protein [Flavobacterium amniphilum]|uniref:VOC family protein n=1 Tax=Flavobacterium amniphilum TaxID=1834035 RepID=UPI002029EB15|nr:VOC family protein [Flavobacterium amniphilum]MCL9805674.1 VOC family protein [Flavobacterium amniphilum]